jgi:hypothetical protein
MKRTTKNKRLVRISVQCEGVMRFFDLPIKRVTEPQLQRAISEAAQSFAVSFQGAISSECQKKEVKQCP